MEVRLSVAASIEALKKKVDASRYRAPSNAQRWVKSLSDLSFDNLASLSLLNPSGLSIKTDDYPERAPIEPVAAYLAALIDSAFKQQINVALSYPPVGSHLPLLWAIGGVLSTGVAGISHRSETPPKPILFVSPDLELRSRYCDIYIGNVRIDDAYPGSRLLATGERVPLNTKAGATPSGNGVCFFLPNLELPGSVGFQPQVVFLDLRFARWQNRIENLVRWATQLKSPVVVLHTLADVEAEHATRQYGFLKFYLDHFSLSLPPRSVDALRSDVDWNMTRASSFLDRKHRIVEVAGDSGIDGLFTTCNDLVEQAGKADATDLSRIRWVLAVLRHLPVPLRWYEETARDNGRSTIRRLISQIGYRSKNVHDIGPVLQTIRMKLDEIYRAIEQSNPKADYAKSIFSEHRRGRLLCISRDFITDKALCRWIDQEFPPAIGSRIDCVAASKYRQMPVEGVSDAFVVGAFPRRYRWIIGGQLAPQVTFAVYPHESDAVQRQLDLLYSPTLGTQCAADRIVTLSKVLGRSIPSNEDSIKMPRLVLDRPSTKPVKKVPKVAASGQSLQDLAQVLKVAESSAQSNYRDLQAEARWEDQSDEDPPEVIEDLGAETTGIDSVVAHRVRVHLKSRGLGTLVLPKDIPVECVRPNAPDQIANVLPDRLAVGDVLLRIDDRGRTTLFDTIVTLVDEQPNMKAAASLRRQWQSAIRYVSERYRPHVPTLVVHGMRIGGISYIDYRKLLTDLQSHGATIMTEQAVRGWLEGTTIGPDSIGSIAAIGKLSHTPSISQNAADFDRAFRKFRSVHQGIGRRLAAAIRGTFRNFAEPTSAKSPELDLSLAVPVAELLDSIDFAEVVEKPSEPQSFSPSQVGRFFKG